MGKVEYDWGIGNPATLEPHSSAKHTILRRYVEEYVKILTSDRRIPDFSLTLVDGFAGGGEYLVEGQDKLHDGSPFILIEAVRAATAVVKVEQRRPIDIKANFIFVEEKPSNYAYLKDALDRRLDKATRAAVTTHQGDFKGCGSFRA